MRRTSYFCFSDLKKCEIIFSTNAYEEFSIHKADCQGVIHADSSHPGLQELFQGRSTHSAMRWALQMKMASHSSQTFASGTAPFSLLQSSRKAQKETDKAAQIGGLH